MRSAERSALNLDRTTRIAGLPIKAVRDAVREMNRHDVNDYGWPVDHLAIHMKISTTHAEWICETLKEQGVLERKPQPDTRWHERGIYYSVSKAGTRFVNATLLKRIDRERVEKLLSKLLQRVKEINANPDFCCFVNEIRLFGSVIDKEAKSFADVDICYLLARRKVPRPYKSWTDWSKARAKLSGRQGLQFLGKITYGQIEVMRKLKAGNPYLSLHDFDDVIGIGAESRRLYIAPEEAIEVEGGGSSGESLSKAAMRAAAQAVGKKARHKADRKSLAPSAPTIHDEESRERITSAVKSLAFDVLSALDESVPLEALERSIEVAHDRIKTYRAANEPERVADILRDTLSIDVIEQKKVVGQDTFVFSGDRERWALDGADHKAAAEKGMKRAVIATLKYILTGRNDADLIRGMTRHFEAYRRAEYDAWKYHQAHGYDWYGPESLSDRAVVTIRRIASNMNEKLDKQALKTLSERGFIKPLRRTKWRLSAKGEVAIKYHDERDAWSKQRIEKRLLELLANKPELTREQGLEMIRYGLE